MTTIEEVVDSLKVHLYDKYCADWHDEKMCNLLDEILEIHKAEQKSGKWIECEDNTSFVKTIPRRWLECSCCHWSCDRGYKTRYLYCPNCGIKMVKPQESEE